MCHFGLHYLLHIFCRLWRGCCGARSFCLALALFAASYQLHDCLGATQFFS